MEGGATTMALTKDAKSKMFNTTPGGQCTAWIGTGRLQTGETCRCKSLLPQPDSRDEFPICTTCRHPSYSHELPR